MENPKSGNPIMEAPPGNPVAGILSVEFNYMEQHWETLSTSNLPPTENIPVLPFSLHVTIPMQTKHLVSGDWRQREHLD